MIHCTSATRSIPQLAYHSAFSAVAALPANLALVERYHPGAAKALTDWAFMRNMIVERREAESWPNGALRVSIGKRDSSGEYAIDVYL